MGKKIEEIRSEIRDLFFCFLNAEEKIKSDLTDDNCKEFCRIYLRMSALKKQLSEEELRLFRIENE